jgi:colicin import membrane protein
MNISQSYRNSFYAALAFHFMIFLLLLVESSTKHPAFTALPSADLTLSSATSSKIEPEPIKAVSVDSQEVMNQVSQLKAERLHQQQVQEQQQRALQMQAASARKERIIEQQRLKAIKEEAAQLALAKEKQVAEEKRHLKELALQKEAEAKRLVAMKQQQLELQKQQQLEHQKLAELQKKQAKALQEAQLRDAIKARDDKARKEQAVAMENAMMAEENARMSGEVDKYKAMIISAISRQWILPENVDNRLSSQFRIRLAPNGAVLEVSLMRSSGDPILDRSAQSAIYKASPLPVPSDPKVFNIFRDISLTVKPETARG